MKIQAKIVNKEVIDHYDFLIEENNDPVLDPPSLQEYMNCWDGDIFIDLLELSSDKSVLEIGCGTGRISKKVAPKVKRFLGIDISLKTVERAREHLKGTIAEILKRDFCCFESDERFDIIYSSLTFMHFSDKAQVLNNVYTLLNSGGKFVLSIDKNQSEVLNYGTRQLKIYPDTPQNIVSLLKAQDFKNVKVIEIQFAFIICANK